MVVGEQKIDCRNCNSHILIFTKQFLRPRQSGAHSTSHACHTLDTPLDCKACDPLILGGEAQ